MWWPPTTFIYGEPQAPAPAPAPTPGPTPTPTPQPGPTPTPTPAPTPPAPPVDHTAPKLAVGKLGKIDVAGLRKGLKVKLRCDERCSIRGDLLVTAKSARIARAGDLTLASRALKSGTGTRSLKLKPSRRLLAGAPNRFRLTLVLVARDGARNERTVSQRVSVRG